MAGSFSTLLNRATSYISKDTLLSNNINWGLVFKLPKNVLMLTDKLKKIPNKINNIFDVSQGYIPYRRKDLIKEYGETKGNTIINERKWHSITKETNEYKEEIFGRSLTRYSYKKTGKYVKYGKHLAGYIEPKYFNQERVLVREITSPYIIATYIKEEFVNDPQIICIIKKDSNSDLLSIWSILNSKLASFYHFNASPKATKGAFPKILVTDVKNFPIPSWEECKKITPIARQLLNITKIKNYDYKNPPIEQYEIEDKINELIFDLYGLTLEEREIVLNS
jgi:hypothetical protein